MRQPWINKVFFFFFFFFFFLIGRIICTVFKVPVIPNWLRMCSKQLKEILRNLFLKKNLLLPRRYEINRFAGPNANLSDLRLATICVTAYTAFLSYINKLASLRCRDVSFYDSLVKIYVYKSKADAYRDGA